MTPVTVKEIADRLEAAPPVPFNVARQVRVFDAYLEYVELSLTGMNLAAMTIAIPKTLLEYGSSLL